MKKRDLIELIGVLFFLIFAALGYFLQSNQELKDKLLPALILILIGFIIKVFSVSKQSEQKEWRDF